MSRLKYLRHHKLKRAPRAGYTVAVIDMQDGYECARNQRTVDEVLNVLRVAIADGAGILLVHWRNFGNVRIEIRRLLRGYPHVRKVFKTKEDGSQGISDACERHRFSRKYIVVCGIQTTVCVAGSVLGLSQRLPCATIEVVKSACGDKRAPDWETFPFPAPIDPDRPYRLPPKPRNLLLTEHLVRPLAGLETSQSKAAAAHPNVMAGWPKRALSTRRPSRRPDVLFPSACRTVAHEND
jgi:hypothetical protein